jgi:signal transduction histidine kinase
MPSDKPAITRWTGAALGFAMGAADTLILRAIGARFELWVGAYFTASFIALGFLLGLLIEARARERTAARRLGEQSGLLAAAELRLAHADKLASLGQLAGTMAHELRNPLAIIRSTVQNLQESLEPGESEARRTCRFVLEEIDRLTRVTASIVRFARPLSVRRTSIDARELLGRAEALGERMLAARGVSLSARRADASVELDVDPDLICQALLGLLDNAAHFSPAGGAVELGLSVAGEEVVFAVDDSGAGVPEELRERLFEPFFTTRDEGTGLGLAIVRQIAQAHGGRVVVSDSPAGGARFELHLPCRAARGLAA